MPAPERIRLIVVFGGRSAEHDVSCVSAFHVLRAVDQDRYDLQAIGITREGDWVRADDALTALNRDAWGREALLSKVQRVRLHKAPQFTLRLDEHTLLAGLHPQSAPSPEQLKSTLEALL